MSENTELSNQCAAPTKKGTRCQNGGHPVKCVDDNFRNVCGQHAQGELNMFFPDTILDFKEFKPNNTQEGDMTEATEEKAPRGLPDGVFCDNCHLHHESVGEVERCRNLGKRTIPKEDPNNTPNTGEKEEATMAPTEEKVPVSKKQESYIVDLLVERNMRVDIDGIRNLTGREGGTASGMIGRLIKTTDRKVPASEQYHTYKQMMFLLDLKERCEKIRGVPVTPREEWKPQYIGLDKETMTKGIQANLDWIKANK